MMNRYRVVYQDANGFEQRFVAEGSSSEQAHQRVDASQHPTEQMGYLRTEKLRDDEAS